MELSPRRTGPRLHLNMALPVLMKEMRSRMRGLRAPVLLLITTGITIAVGLIIIMTQWSDYADDVSGLHDSMANIGHSLFIGLIIVEAILAALIAPALTAGSISIEREQQTLEFLLLTRLSCHNILLGKLVSSLSFLLMMMLCSLPVLAISFLLGGVDPAMMGWALVMIVATVTLFGGIAIYCSTRYPRTATSVAIAYCLCVIWLAVIPLFGGLYETLYDSSGIIVKGNTPFIIYAIFAGMVLGLIPTAVLSIFLAGIIRRPVPRVVNILLWLLIAGAGIFGLLTYPDYLHNTFANSQNVFWVFVGHPVMGFAAILYQNDIFSGASGAIKGLFIPLTAAIIFCCAGLIIVQAIRELRKLRDNLQPEPRTRKPKKVKAQPPTQPAEV